jgi:hypothetical protein
MSWGETRGENLMRLTSLLASLALVASAAGCASDGVEEPTPTDAAAVETESETDDIETESELETETESEAETGTDTETETETEPVVDDPFDESTWDVDADDAQIRRQFSAVRSAFLESTRDGFAALAEMAYPVGHTGDSMAECNYQGDFPGYDVLDGDQLVIDMRWTELLPEPEWQLTDHGQPADEGYRVYLADFVDRRTWVVDGIADSQEQAGSAHVAVGADGQVVWFPACDEYLP